MTDVSKLKRVAARFVAVAIAVTAVGTGVADSSGMVDAAAVPGRSSQQSLYVAVYRHNSDSRARATTAELEARLGFTSEYRYLNALKGFAARLSSAQLEAVRRHGEIRAVRRDPARYVAAYVPGPFGAESEIETRMLEAAIGFTSVYRFRHRPFTGFEATLDATQLAKLESAAGIYAIRPTPWSYVAHWRPPPENAEQNAKKLSRKLRFRLIGTGASTFAAGLSSRQLLLLSRERAILLVRPIEVQFAIFPNELFQDRNLLRANVWTATARDRLLLRETFTRSHPRYRASDVRGPLGRVYVARLGGYEYALATFRSPPRTKPALQRFGRKLTHEWLDLGAAGPTVCAHEIPVTVIKAWKVEPAPGGCYRAGR